MIVSRLVWLAVMAASVGAMDAASRSSSSTRSVSPATRSATTPAVSISATQVFAKSSQPARDAEVQQPAATRESQMSPPPVDIQRATLAIRRWMHDIVEAVAAAYRQYNSGERPAPTPEAAALSSRRPSAHRSTTVKRTSPPVIIPPQQVTSADIAALRDQTAAIQREIQQLKMTAIGASSNAAAAANMSAHAADEIDARTLTSSRYSFAILAIGIFELIATAVAFVVMRAMQSPHHPARTSAIALPAPQKVSSTSADHARARPSMHRYSRGILLRLIRICGSLQLKLQPVRHNAAWTLGLASTTGPVRTRNEDCGTAFEIGDYRAVVIADGCGGHPLGAEASRFAVEAASMSIVNHVNQRTSGEPGSAESIASQAVNGAADSLAAHARSMGLAEKDALRTTLIVVIVTEHEVGFCHIGDGGGVVLRSSGTMESFIHPQKGDQPNVLTGWLGPVMGGRPVAGTLRRDPGDFIVIGSDGIFDRVPSRFVKDLLRAAVGANGRLDSVASSVLHEMSRITDSGGAIADDNMTLAIVGPGKPPVLARDFWRTEPDIEAMSKCKAVPSVTTAVLSANEGGIR
jgi:serine/threonine protein phosphatase PrpC